MKYIYLDASAGLSGDMCLGALLDLGIARAGFKRAMNGLGLPVAISFREVERSHLRGLKIDVKIKGPGSPARHWADIERFIRRAPLAASVKERGG
jgi:uncharacterized protein (DUF111 family)